MNGRRIRTLAVLASLALAVLASLAPPTRVGAAKGGLKKADAQKLIAAYSLFELGKGAVTIKEITTGDAAATVVAGVRVGFRFARDESGKWRAAEMRVGDRQWEDLDLLARAFGADSARRSRAALDDFAAELDALALAKRRRDDEKKQRERRDEKQSGGRDAKNSREAKQVKEPGRKAKKADEKAKKAEQQLADEPELVRGALRVKNPESALSPMGNSAFVEAEIEAAFDVVREGGQWRIASVRVGGEKLPDFDAAAHALDAEKAKAARADLEDLASALEAFRRERGFYVVADSETVLVDFLNPRYTARFIRIDPWHRPYEYKGTRDRFLLRSWGSDGKPNTSDDVTLVDDLNNIHRNNKDN